MVDDNTISIPDSWWVKYVCDSTGVKYRVVDDSELPYMREFEENYQKEK